MSELNTALIAQLARAYAILVIVSIITLILLYSGLRIFGPINDLTNAVAALVVAAFAWQLHRAIAAQRGYLATLLLAAAWLGALSVAGNSVLVAAGRMGWQTGGMYTAFGYGLFGLWLFGALPAIGAALALPSSLLILGRWAAIAMSVGLLGILPLLSVVALNSPLAYTAMAAIAAGWLLFPWWAFRLSQHLT